MWQELLNDVKNGNVKSLARAISLIENEHHGYEQLLLTLPVNAVTKVIGITGPPGAGKSTLTDALIGEIVKEERKVQLICVDHSSPYNRGALLGVRIRMNEW